MKKFLGVLTALAVTFCILGNAHAQSSSYDTTVIAPQQKPTTGYDGGFFVASPDGTWKMKFGVRVDTMFFWGTNNVFDDLTTPQTDESKDELSFRLRRAQAWFKAKWKNLSAFVLIGHGVSSGGAGTYWVASATYDVNPHFAVQWGIEDPGYGLFSITSSKRMTMVDNPIVMTQKDGEQTVWQGFEAGAGRSISRPSFGLPTQMGIFLWGNHFNNRFNWTVSVGNGVEGTATTNQNRRFQYAARLSYVILGESPYGDMTDLAYSQNPSLAVGLGGAFEHDPQKVPTGQPSAGLNQYNWSMDGTADIVFKWRGLALNAMGYYRALNVGPAAVVERGEKYLSDMGYLAAVSMFAIPKRLEFQGFGAQIFREGPDNNAYEFGGGVNLYLNGHQAKLQIDYTRVTDYDDLQGTNNRIDNRVRAKAQVYF